MNEELDALRAMLGTVGNVSDTVLAAALAAGELSVYDGPPRVAVPHRDNAAVRYAVRLQAARLYKRRQSPEGVAGWGELGVIRISPRDSDITDLLGPYLDLTDAGVA